MPTGADPDTRAPEGDPRAEPDAAEGGDASARPTWFHLLSDREIAGLRPVLEILRDQREVVLSRWFASYVEHFGEARTLTEEAFRELYGRDLDAVVHNLLGGDMQGFEADVRRAGHDLIDRGVPFAEVVASLHLFEEAAAASFSGRLKVMLRAPDIYLTFDKLSHCRMILLAGAYFAGHEAAASAEHRRLRQDAAGSERTVFHGLVGASAPMRRLYEQIAAAAGGHGAAIVVGESGTGKELVARALHAAAGAARRPFVAVNCAALPRELIESELFGHRKGAYTGAQAEYVGLVRAASGGTVFLDEITEMAAETQAKLLRVLEERAVRPVGTAREVPVEVRFTASTNRDPEEAVGAGRLREDLWYRLSVYRIEVPPLRDRLDDVPLLCDHFAHLLAERGLPAVRGFSDEALRAMQGYAWPGNVRELKNAVEQAMTVARGGLVRREDLPARVLREARAGAVPAGPAGVPTMAEAERDLILRALEVTGGNKLRAARLLRISRHRLYDKLRKFGIG